MGGLLIDDKAPYYAKSLDQLTEEERTTLESWKIRNLPASYWPEKWRDLVHQLAIEYSALSMAAAPMREHSAELLAVYNDAIDRIAAAFVMAESLCYDSKDPNASTEEHSPAK